jgi:hypothetical protein
MRWLGFIVPSILLVSAACDNKQDAAGAGSDSSAGASSDEGGSKAPAIAMPERPVPRPQFMVGSGMSIEIQQKAISYMVAMRAPHLDDVPAEPTYAADLVTKLKPIVLSMDSGSGGCDEKTPLRAVVSRAGVPFATLVSHGVLVIRCNDVKIQCLQSTRDPDDVLCTTAPRHK